MPRRDLASVEPRMLRANQEQKRAPSAGAPKSGAGATVLPNQEQEPPDAIASELFSAALDAARMTNAEVAYVLGVSESLVRKMRSKDAREGISLIQMIKLGPRFLWEFHRALHAKCKFGRQALTESVQALSLLAVGIE